MARRRKSKVVNRMMRGGSQSFSDRLRGDKDERVPQAGPPMRRGREDPGLSIYEEVMQAAPEAPMALPPDAMGFDQSMAAGLDKAAEPGIPEGIYEFALSRPDILRRAETGEMTSEDLLKALIEARGMPKRVPGVPGLE